MTYTMSKDYDALYDLLCGGGEAFVVIQDVGKRTWGREMAQQYDRVFFKDGCTRLSLEWLAPVDIAEVIAAGDSLHKRLGSDIDYLTMSAKAEAMEEREHWTDATAKHRTT